MIEWSGCPVVECVEGRCGGVPVLRGTRLPIAAILDNHDDGCTPEQIAHMFEVAVTDVQAVLAYRTEANRQETVSTDALHRRIDDMSDAELASLMERVNHDVATGSLIDATGWAPEQLRAFLLLRVRTPPATAEQIIQAAIDPPAASLTVTDDTTDEELSAFIQGKRRGQHR